MRFIAWNVNGIKSSLDKGLIEFVKNQNADFYCFQETRTNKERSSSDLNDIRGYNDYWHSAKKKGYSGVVTYAKDKALSVTGGMGIDTFDEEGRILTLEYDEFYLLNVYFINSGRNLNRLDEKKWFNNEFFSFCEDLRKKKPIIIGGDLNVAHEEKDIANPEKNQNNAGFTTEEREWFSHFLKKGYIDAFREFEPDGGHYTFWSYRYNSREKNIGWRLDYWIISEELNKFLKKCEHLDDVKGSDHCPILLELEL